MHEREAAAALRGGFNQYCGQSEGADPANFMTPDWPSCLCLLLPQHDRIPFQQQIILVCSPMYISITWPSPSVKKVWFLNDSNQLNIEELDKLFRQDPHFGASESSILFKYAC